MTDFTNYGILLKKGITSVGEIVSIDSPELINAVVESTYHRASPNNWREFVSGGLQEVSEFKFTLNQTDNGLATLITDLGDGSCDTYTITFPNTDVFTFTAIVTGVKPLSSDAKSPDVMIAEITMRPSGSATLS